MHAELVALPVASHAAAYSVDIAAINHDRETGLAGAVTYSDGRVGVKLVTDVSSHEMHALIAVGYQFSDRGYIILGGSTAREKTTLMKRGNT